MSGLIKVGFLFDEKNSWIYDFMKDFICFNEQSKTFNFTTIFNKNTAVNFDILFILGFTKIIEAEILKKNKLCLIIHESDLPNGRGFSPVQWQILEGKNSIPVCMIEASAKVDEGDIILKSNIELEGHELLDEIRQKQAEISKQLITDFLNIYPNFTKTPQKGKVSYFPKRRRYNDMVNTSESIASQFNKLRITDNQKYPAFFLINGHKYELIIRKTNGGE